MLNFTTPNINQVFDDIEAWLLGEQLELEAVAKGLAYAALSRLLENSPQSTGDFAANWKLSVENVDYSFQVGAVGGKRRQYIRGDDPAIEAGWRAAAGRLEGFRLGGTIWLSNSAAHDEAYAWKIEGNTIRFRPGNYGETVRLTVDDMRIHYGELDREKVGVLTRAIP